MLTYVNSESGFQFSTFNQLPFGILVRESLTLKPIFLNLFLERFLGISLNKLKDIPLEQQPKVLFPLSQDEYDKLLRYQKLCEPFKAILIVKNDPPMWFECMLTYGLDGYCIEIYSDQTREIQLQKELERKNQELETFSKILSHDIKGALFTLKGYIGFLNSETDANRLKDIFLGISRSESRLSRIVETCMQYYKAINKKVDLTRVNLDGLLERVTSFYSEELRSCGASVHLKVNNLEVLADEALLETVFRNLLSNSIKFRAENRPLIVEVAATRSDRSIEISFADNGKGLKVDQIPKLFQPFSRFHSGIEGSGLGLSLVKNLVEKLGGSISAEYQDCGVRFILKLRAYGV